MTTAKVPVPDVFTGWDDVTPEQERQERPGPGQGLARGSARTPAGRRRRPAPPRAPDGLDRLATVPDLLDHHTRTDLITTGIGYLRLPEHEHAAAALTGIDDGRATHSTAAFFAM